MKRRVIMYCIPIKWEPYPLPKDAKLEQVLAPDPDKKGWFIPLYKDDVLIGKVENNMFIPIYAG